MVAYKLQIACLVIIIFIGTLFFAAKRETTRLHKSFASILIMMPVYLISDILSAYTVNNYAYLYCWQNNLAHRFFLISITIVVYLFSKHVQNLVTNEAGLSNKRRQVIVGSKIVLLVSIAVTICAKPSYVTSKYSNYASAKFAAGAFAAVSIYVLTIIVTIIYYWRLLPRKKRLAILLGVVMEFVGLLLQYYYTYLLLSGFTLTMMTLAFYLTMDNPDIALLEEMSEEKRKVEELSNAKSSFISVVSHEIRTPMNAIIGMTDILLRDSKSLDETQEKYLKNIKSSGDALVMIVNDILDQSKLESGKMELVEGSYNIFEITNDVRLIIENRIGDKDIELQYEIDDTIPEYLVGDGLRIRQILINLLNNAVKFTESGFIRLSIKNIRSEVGRCQIRFAVRDSGQGIKPADLMKLGEAFTQVDVAKNHNKEGTGLGLSISRDFIRLMDSQLEVASEYGKGSEFSFVIWQKVDDGDSIKNLRDEFTASDVKLLFVDDSALNLTIDKELVKPLLVEADTATSGREALAKVTSEKYDIVFLDNMMPHMTGVEVAEIIRGMTGKDYRGEGEVTADYFEKLPIVVLSGDGTPETVAKFEAAKTNGYIIKPVDIKDLKKMIIKCVDETKIQYIE